MNNANPVSILSDQSLLTKTKALAQEERRITTEILLHLREIYRRRLYAPLGYSTMHEYCVKELKYSSGAACRRLDAMKLMVELPEIKNSIEDGTLSVSTASQVQSFLKTAPVQLSAEDKRELVKSVEGMSRRECEKILVALAPEAPKPDRERVIAPNKTEIRFVADDDFLEMMERIKEVMAINPGYLELFRKMGRQVLKQLDPMEKQEKKRARADGKSANSETSSNDQANVTDLEGLPVDSSSIDSSTPPAGPTGAHTRYISASVKRDVWKRDAGQCTFQEPASGRRCTSRWGLELDHIISWALGGSNETENIRLRCKTHNLHHAIETYGQEKMGRYLRK